ncbi:MAG: type II secretion system protein GspM [Desulfuromonadaceae bacterium]|nr:type II secretion system protein GspM [Desulfuromonadaceae bacterium]
MISNLSMREKVILASGIFLSVLILLYMALISPFSSKLRALERKISAGEIQLHELKSLQEQYQQLEHQITQIGNDSRDNATGLLSFVENQVQQVAGRDKLTSMRPIAPIRHDDMLEEGVEVRIERVTLRQIVDMLQRLEQARRTVRIKGLDLKVRFEDKALFDATMLISTFSKG